jgi:hypothetical protein
MKSDKICSIQISTVFGIEIIIYAICKNATIQALNIIYKFSLSHDFLLNHLIIEILFMFLAF